MSSLLAAALVLLACGVLALSGAALAGKGGNKGKPDGGGGDGGIVNPAFVCVKEGRLVLFTSDGAAQERLTSPKGKASDFAPVWSPDPDGDPTNGHQGVIAFLRRPDHFLYTIRPDGTQMTLISSFESSSAPAEVEEVTLTWAPDGSRIVYSTYSSLWAVDLNGNIELVFDSQDLPNGLDEFWGVSDAAFSPDMEPDTPGYQGRLAFRAWCFSNDELGQDIWLLDVEIDDATGALATGALVNLTNSPTNQEAHPAWSPDGSYLAFHDLGPKDGVFTDMVVLLHVATGGDPTPLFAVVIGGNGRLTWSPDGAYLGFDDDTGIGNWDLFYTSPWDASAPIVDVTQSKLVERELDWNPAWVNDIDP